MFHRLCMSNLYLTFKSLLLNCYELVQFPSILVTWCYRCYPNRHYWCCPIQKTSIQVSLFKYSFLYCIYYYRFTGFQTIESDRSLFYRWFIRAL